MSLVKRAAQSLLNRFGIEFHPSTMRDGRYTRPSYSTGVAMSPEARAYLTRDNPRLLHLRRAYAELDLPPMFASKWGDGRIDRDLDLPVFRGDNPYVWQYRQYADNAHLRFFLALLDVRAQDALGLLNRLEEDGAFGCWTFTYSSGRPFSRDLLDSVIELNYIESLLGLSNKERFRILDIGAGYGRLAHRAVESFPSIVTYDCVDSIAESSFLCEFYLEYRGLAGRAQSIAMDELHLLQETYDLAVNIHSFSESSHASIMWWIQLLLEKNVRHLLIIPNDDGDFLSSECDGSKRDYLPDILNAGYRLIDSRPVYVDEDLREMIGVHDQIHLFQLGAYTDSPRTEDSTGANCRGEI